MKQFISLIFILLWAQNLWADNQLISVAITSAPNNLVPFYSTDANSQNINRLLHLSLIEMNRKMQYECSACESFKEEFLGEKHILDFKLKKDLKFTDGSSITAADVKKSWEFFAKNSEIKSTFMDSFENLEDVQIVDSMNLKFIYKNFSLENISNLTALKIIKLKKISSNIEVEDIVGAGKYVVEKVLPLEILIAPLDKQRPKFIFKVVKDETTLALKLINKEIDLSVASISARKVEWLQKNNNILRIWNLPSSNYVFLGMNQMNDLFKIKEVRQAISLIIPRDDLAKYKLKNSAVLSTGMFSSAFADFYEAYKNDSYDPSSAAKLLESVNIKKDKFGWYNYKGKPIVIDWKVSNNKSSIENVEILKNYFEKFGIKVNITILEWGTYMSNFKAGKFDIVMGQWIGFATPDMLRFVFHSENIPPKGGNRIRYSNPIFDKAIDLATNETDEKKRNELYKKANKIVTEDHAYVSMWHPNVIWVARNCLSNIELEPTGSFQTFPKVEKNCE